MDERELQVLFETVPMALLVLAPDRPRFTIVAATEAYLRATRTTRDIVGRGIFEVFPDDPESSGRNARLSFERVLETAAPDTMAVQKHSIQRPASEGGGFEERFWSPVNTPVLGPRGEVLYIHHRVEDVTELVRERRRAEQREAIAEALRTRAGEMEADVLGRGRELPDVNRQLRVANERLAEVGRTSEARLQRLYDSGMIGVFYFDLDGSITDANGAFLDLVGYARADVESGRMRWEWVTPAEHRAADEHALAELRERGVDPPYERELLRRDGARVTVLIGAALVDDARRHGIAFVLDVTDRKQAREALLAANEKLREADRRKDEFLGMLSHELRNPLAPIRSSTYLLRQAAPGSDQARRAQAVIERQTEHLTRLVDDLLDVTRIARGKIELRRSRSDVREVVRRAADDFRAILEDRGVAFRTALPEGRVWADVDPTRITQVVGNVLHNAAKFTRRGDQVTLSLAVERGGALIRVRDTGAGIDAALLPSVFDPFVQGERTLARTDGGLGLGLALVKGLTELHGGTVEVASEGKGRGSEFTIRLPVIETSLETPPRRVAVDRRAGGRRVLVVDDNADAAETLAEVVRAMGHEVEVAYDGRTAVESVRATRPDVVLCDLGLPGMSGYDVAREVRAAMDGTVRLVAVSGYAQPEDVTRSFAAGFDAHVAKPPDLAHLERLLS